MDANTYTKFDFHISFSYKNPRRYVCGNGGEDGVEVGNESNESGWHIII